MIDYTKYEEEIDYLIRFKAILEKKEFSLKKLMDLYQEKTIQLALIQNRIIELTDVKE